MVQQRSELLLRIPFYCLLLAVCAQPLVTRFPDSGSGACFGLPHSSWSRPFAPAGPPRLPPPCSQRSALQRPGQTNPVRSSGRGEVRIVRPGHPMDGQVAKVASTRLDGDGDLQLTVELRSGKRVRLPVRWTDWEGPVSEERRLFGQLREYHALRELVTALQRSRGQRERTSLGGAADGSAGPSGVRTAVGRSARSSARGSGAGTGAGDAEDSGQESGA